MSEPLTVYLAGPMSNIPQFNFPLFILVAEALRNRGFDIISPAETDPEDVRQAALASVDGKYDPNGKVGSETWGDMLARDVKMLADGLVEQETDAEFKARALATIGNQEDGNPNDVTLARKVTLRVVHGIALLPGWERSRGARLEAFVGMLAGKSFYTVSMYTEDGPFDACLVPANVEWVQHMLALAWAPGIAMHRPYDGGDASGSIPGRL